MSKITTERHYKITLSDGSTYYGRTIMGDLRYKQHLGQARRGDHENPNIQEVYDKYGYDDWVHKWLSTETGDKRHHDKIEYGYVQADPKALNIKSGSWVLDKKKYMNHYMNLRNKALPPEEKEETKRKQREHQREKLLNMTPEERDEHNRKQRERYHKHKQKRL